MHHNSTNRPTKHQNQMGFIQTEIGALGFVILTILLITIYLWDVRI